MAVKKKKKAVQNGGNYFVISVEKKKKILGFFLLILSLISALSILSYSRYDQAILTLEYQDLVKVFSTDPVFAQKVNDTQNWLGIFGSYVSDFLINSTIGYFSLIFSVILFLWGYTVVRNSPYKLSIHISNLLLAAGILFASFFGLLRFEHISFYDNVEMSGSIGYVFGAGIGRLLGEVGGIILFFFLIVVVLIIAFDIKIEKIFSFLKHWLADAFEEKEEAIKINKETETVTEDNISKIKKLRVVKKKDKKNLESEPAVEDNAPAPNRTTISIVKRDEREKVIETEIDEDIREDKGKERIEESEEEIDWLKEKDLPEQWEEEIKFNPPKISLLNMPSEEDVKIPEEELKKNAELLKEKLALFDIEIKNISVTPGPVVTLYEIVPAPGVKISRIVNLQDDIALALAAKGIRIIAPIPGKSAIGVEIPNREAILVAARSVISKIKDTKADLPLALGKTISGDVYITDLSKMPHLLIAGSTGAGKSVGVNMMINSLLFSKHPSEIKFVIVDPKKIELSFYKYLNKHYLAVSPDLSEEIITDPQNALIILRSVEIEMDQRYNKLAKAGVRNIVDYNNKIADPARRPKDTEKMKHFKLPYIVVVIDELADLMITSGKEVEEPIARLAQLARAVGIHLIIATQRPSVNVITGVIKANFSARIAYQVASKIDSRTILDMNGAEQLLGRGDMLFLPGGEPKPVRIQNAFISTEEVEEITKFIYVQKGYSKRYMLPSLVEESASRAGNLDNLDPMFHEAASVIVRHQQGSVSLLQRKLKLGYSRAARIVDQLEEAGIVGPPSGSKPRDVKVEDEEELQTVLRSL